MKYGNLVEFMNKYGNRNVISIISVRIKTDDDEHGFVGEHYEVQCVVKTKDGDSIRDCLVDRQRLEKFLKQKETPVIWK